MRRCGNISASAVLLIGLNLLLCGCPVQETAPVPNVVGFTQAAAQTVLEAAGFHLGTVQFLISEDHEPGTVLVQVPVAGTSVATGTLVNLVLVRAPEVTEGEEAREGDIEPVEGEGEVLFEGEGAAEGDDDAIGAYGVVISEFLAVNHTGLRDEDGDTSDWIELYNATDAPISLYGWSLTDNPAHLDKWRLPTLTLGPRSFLVVFASGKDRRPTDGGNLHTNFQLESNGEYLALVKDAVVPLIASQFTPGYPEQLSDFSFGWVEGQGYFFFNHPTPGAANDVASASPGQAPQPAFSVLHGFFDAPVALSLSSRLSGGSVYYTLDGSQPSETPSELYLGPIVIEQNAVVRAKVFADGYYPSETQTQTYIITPPETQKGLPALCMTGDPHYDLYEPYGIMAVVGGAYDDDGVWYALDPDDYNNLLLHGADYERCVSLESFDAAGTGGFQQDSGVRLQGSPYRRTQYRPGDDWVGVTWDQWRQKKSFRFYFRDEYGNDALAFPLIPGAGVPHLHRFILRSGTDDWKNPFVRDELARRLMRDIGHVSPYGTFVHLYINASFRGYFNAAERPDQQFFQDHYASSNEWDVIKREDQYAGSALDGDLNAFNEMMNLIAFSDMTDAANYAAAGERLDIPQFVDYLILQLYAANWDWPGNNWYAARERSANPALNRFRWYLWDTEAGFMQTYNAWDLLTTNPFLLDWSSRLVDNDNIIGALYNALKPSPEFRALWKARAEALLATDGPLGEANVKARFQELRAIMEPVLMEPPMDAFIYDHWATERPAILMEWFRQEGLLDTARRGFI